MSFQSRHQHFDPANQFVTAATPRQTLGQRIVFTLSLWRQRIEIRRRLAELDSRSLRDIGISPAAAAYESGKPFWQKMGCLR
jgi:uncharacterized protein YjiS (DUF1127 family)